MLRNPSRCREGSSAAALCALMALLLFLALGATAAGAEIEGIPEPRAWEQVSPQIKGGGEIEPLHDGAVQAAENGLAITYLASGVTGERVEGNSNLTQVLSARTESGWSSQDIATAHEAETSQSVGAGQEYRLFAPDLKSAVVEPFGETPLPPLEAGAEPTPYVRSALQVGTGPLYTPLVTAADTTENEHFSEPAFRVRFVAASPDLKHVLMKSRAGLTPKAVRSENAENLYEWADGQLRLVNVLPNGHSTTEEGQQAFLGFRDSDLRGVISADGEQVVWTGEQPAIVQHLYVTDMTSGKSVQIDASQGGSATGSEENDVAYQAASRDGRVIFFTDDARLTPDSKASPGADDLYACLIRDVEEAPVCQLRDVTSSGLAPGGGGVQGLILGASEDGTTVYFVATGELTEAANREGETAEAGAPNLYVAHLNGETWEEPRFVAELSNEDRPVWGGESNGVLGRLTARVSPDGNSVAFMSERSLTGYDNVDKASGAKDEEVFLYDYAQNRTICPSCDPSGAAPAGIFDSREQNSGNGLLVDQVAGGNQNNWSGHWLAGNIPGWTLIEENEALYQARYLSNSGRLYFESTDPLSTSDSNGKEDVYEYEPAGVPQGHPCGESDASYSFAAVGCVNLLSGGVSASESAILDVSAAGGEGHADEGGGDVFFITSARLSPSDIDGSFDVYDAHECTSSVPCMPPRPVSAVECQSLASCQGGSPTSVGEQPSATTFENGGGNLPAPAKTKPKATGRPTEAQALRRCKRYRRKRLRAACVRRVHKQYAKRPVKRKKAGK